MSYEETRKMLDTSVERTAAANEHVRAAQERVLEAVKEWQEINANRPPEQDGKIKIDATKIFEVAAAAVRASTEAASLVDYYAKSRLAMEGETPTAYEATPHYTPAKTQDRPQAPSNPDHGDQSQNNGEQTTDATTQEETPTGRPSLLPTYTPMEAAAEIARVDQWRNDEPVQSGNTPTATLSLTAADRELLEAYIRENPSSEDLHCAPGQALISDDRAHPHGVPDAQVQAILQQTANAMHSHIAYDLARAELPVDANTVPAVHLIIGEYSANSAANMAHVDALEEIDDNSIRYVTTVVGPTTQFGHGTIQQSNFARNGDVIEERQPRLAWASSLPGQVSRFPSTTAHRAPTMDKPTPRIFGSATYYLPGTNTRR